MRADRLVSMVLLLRSRGRMSAATLAKELAVSQRTVLRDIDALSLAGVPVYAERGRYGGFELLPGFQTELTGLNYEESIALLVAASRRGVQGVGLGSALAAAVLKVIDALPGEHKVLAAGAAERILLDPEIDLLARRHPVAELPAETISAVRNAVIRGRKLRIHYTAIDRAPAWRTVDPIGLVSVRDQVYLLALRDGEDRTYRISRVLAAESLSEPAERSETIDLQKLWEERSRKFREGGEQVMVQLKVRRSHLKTLSATALAVVREAGNEEEWLTLQATFQDDRHAKWALWELGVSAEAL